MLWVNLTKQQMIYDRIKKKVTRDKVIGQAKDFSPHAELFICDNEHVLTPDENCTLEMMDGKVDKAFCPICKNRLITTSREYCEKEHKLVELK